MDAKEQVQEVNEETLHSEAQEIDWKAEARKWEKRAKESQTQAREYSKLKKAQEEQMSDLERALKRAEEAEKKLYEREEQETISRLIKETAKKYGVSEDLIRGTTEQEIDDHAQLLAQALKVPSAPTLSNDGSVPTPKEMQNKDIFGAFLQSHLS